MARPHELIQAHYASDEAKRRYLRELFDRGARHYNRLERLASLGTGHLYRKQALQRAGLQPGMTVLDMACGTGAVTRAIAEVLGGQGRAIGVDPSPGMLAQARAHVPAEFHEGHAEALPFTDASFDFLSMGYALRHVGDLHGAFAECRRVLKPGGRLLLLEITKPRARMAGALVRFYFRTGLPWLTRLSGGDRAACEMASYFWETIDACVPPETILTALQESGFVEVNCHRQLGLFSEYRGRKPQRP